jgi:GntR family carbon starvation induced transcriptional regulator
MGTVSEGQGRGRPGKATRASRVAERLREAILTGALKPGAKVNLDQMREAFGVSLSPLREAIARLVPTGLVEFEDQRGYRIAPLSRENLAEVTRLRADLESLALGYACDSAGLDWEGAVLGALHRLGRTERDPARPETLEAWEAAHTEFHVALIGGCGMPMLIDFCRTLHTLNDRYRRVLLAHHPGDRDVAAEHEAIAGAAVARDGPKAAALLRAHIERTGTRLAERIGAALPEAGR